jgi:hypothetical protein
MFSLQSVQLTRKQASIFVCNQEFLTFSLFTYQFLKNVMFLDVTPCGSCKNRRFVGRLLVAASFVPSSPILVNLMMEALLSSETSVLARVTQRKIPEDSILHSYRRQSLRSYVSVLMYVLKCPFCWPQATPLLLSNIRNLLLHIDVSLFVSKLR